MKTPIKLLSPVALLFCAVTLMLGQANPVITSFSPGSGPVGTVVTITGTDFDPVAANNVVYFGATKATVTSATTTSLTVTVSSGATYKPISVTTGGLTAYSASPFVVTFTPNWTPDPLAFENKVDFGIGSQGWVVLQDFDGDGKADVAVAEYYVNKISVFRNTSSAGTITTGSFATKVDFAAPSAWYLIAADFDGDGKPDLAWRNYNGRKLGTLRNTSTPGTVSFVDMTEYSVVSRPTGLTAADIDGDGRTDLVMQSEDSDIRILSNTGSVGTISFAHALTLATWHTGYSGLTVSDIDGDSRPDIVSAHMNGHIVRVWRNLCSPGSFLFASSVAFATGSNPRYVAAGDLDGDGKQDIVVANWDANTVSVLRNASTSGNINLESKVDYSTGAQALHPAVADVTGDGKLDIVVTNYNSNSVSVFRNTGSSGTIGFDPKVDYIVGTNPNNVELGDIDGDGAPDIVCSNHSSNSFSVLRNKLIIGIPPAITLHPQDQTLCAGTSVIIEATASGMPDPAVQWQSSTDAGSIWSDIEGANAVPLTFTATVEDNARQYRAVFTNIVGTATTNAATLTVNSAPSITLQPADQTVILGSDALFTVAVAGSPTPSIQWQSSTDDGANWSDIADSMNISLTIPSTTLAMNGYKYRVHAANTCGETCTNVATLSVITIPGIVNGTVRVGETGLANATVTLLNANGASLDEFPPVTTNSLGQYSFVDVPSPLSYQVIIVEPLGYSVEQNPKSASLSAGGTATVDFALTPAVLANNARGMGYWKHQFDVYLKGRGNAQETEQQLYDYIRDVHRYYSEHFPVFTGLTELSEWSAVLSKPNNASMRDKAKQHLATLVLNFASLKIGQYFIVTADSRTAGDALTYASIVVSNSSATNAELERAKDVAEKVNNKEMIAAGVVPAGGGVLYKGAQGITWGFDVPAEYALGQNYPNPFNPTTTIRYQLPSDSQVSLKVYDIAGREVATLVDEMETAGYRSVRFDATGLASGVYLFRMSAWTTSSQAGSFTDVKKMLILK